MTLTLNDITKSIKQCKKVPEFSLDINTHYLQPLQIPKKVGEYMIPEIIETSKNSFEYIEGEVIDFPNFLSSKIDLNSYFIYGVNKENCIYESILHIVDPNFKLEENSKKQIFIQELKDALLDEYESIYKKNNYKKEGIKKADIKTSIDQNNITPGLLMLLCDYFGINLFCINIENESTSIVFSEKYNDKVITLIKYRNIYLPIVNIYGNNPYVLYTQIKNKFD